MSLNNIFLNTTMLADLYSDVLIEIDATGVPETVLNNYLGSNEKNILIVVNKADAVYVEEEELSFLTNVLSACSLSLADVAIINWHNRESASIVAELHSKQVLLFGLSPLQFGLPINFPNFQNQNFNNTIYLTAPDLFVISKDVNLKKELWTSLKKMFSI